MGVLSERHPARAGRGGPSEADQGAEPHGPASDRGHQTADGRAEGGTPGQRPRALPTAEPARAGRDTWGDTRDAVQRHIRERGPASLWRAVQPAVASKRAGQPLITADQVDIDALNKYFVEIGVKTSRTVDRSGPELPVRLPRVSTGSFVVSPLHFFFRKRTVMSRTMIARRTQMIPIDSF